MLLRRRGRLLVSFVAEQGRGGRKLGGRGRDGKCVGLGEEETGMKMQGRQRMWFAKALLLTSLRPHRIQEVRQEEEVNDSHSANLYLLQYVQYWGRGQELVQIRIHGDGSSDKRALGISGFCCITKEAFHGVHLGNGNLPRSTSVHIFSSGKLALYKISSSAITSQDWRIVGSACVFAEMLGVHRFLDAMQFMAHQSARSHVEFLISGKLYRVRYSTI